MADAKVPWRKRFWLRWLNKSQKNTHPMGKEELLSIGRTSQEAIVLALNNWQEKHGQLSRPDNMQIMLTYTTFDVIAWIFEDSQVNYWNL